MGIVVPPFLAERQTAPEASRYVASIIRRHAGAWHTQQILLIGYSRGAGILPFVASRLPRDLRRAVHGIALIGLEPEIDFKYARRGLFHRTKDEMRVPVLPELRKIGDLKIICVQGSQEGRSICPKLTGLNVQQLTVAGTHHISSNRRDLAIRILQRYRDGWGGHVAIIFQVYPPFIGCGAPSASPYWGT